MPTRTIDYGLATRELAKMIREAGVDLPRMSKLDFDDPFGTTTGSGVIFGATGGVMEAAIRTVLELVTGTKIENLFAEQLLDPKLVFLATILKSPEVKARIAMKRRLELPPMAALGDGFDRPSQQRKISFPGDRYWTLHKPVV